MLPPWAEVQSRDEAPIAARSIPHSLGAKGIATELFESRFWHIKVCYIEDRCADPQFFRKAARHRICIVISEARRLFQAAAPLGVPGILVLTLGRRRPGSSERLELRMDMSGFEHVARKRLGGGLEALI